MQGLLVAAMLVGVVGGCGKKRNPDRCCIDEADCEKIGLPNGSTCPDGELCRGNECIELTCSMSFECDPTAPYCENGTCAATCVADSSCPGFHEGPLPFCIAGACVQCREGMNDCPGNGVCSGNKCGNCGSDDECPSGVCLPEGRCASVDAVAYVSPIGSSTSACRKNDACTLDRGLTIEPAREFIKLAPGTYSGTGHVVRGKRRLTGISPAQTRVTNTAGGSVFTIDGSADVTIEQLEIFGATSGSGITSTAGGVLRVFDSKITGNAENGITSLGSLVIQRSSITSNTGFGISASGTTAAPALIERVVVSANTGTGVRMQANGVLRNSFVFRNGGSGLELTSNLLGVPQTEFNTIVANSSFGAFCFGSGAQPVVANSIVSAHPTDIQDCASGGSLTSGDGNFFFLSPNTQPYDYHIGQGSFAINKGGSAPGIDFDGDARPKGAANDVGADEAF